MFLTVVAGVIIALLLLGVIGAISQESPGCAGLLLIAVTVRALENAPVS